MERLPGITYEDAIRDKYTKNPTLTEEDEDAIAREIAGYVQQLRALQSPKARTADGQLLRNFPFWRWQPEAQWQLMPTHEEDKKEWYQKSLSGVDRTDLAELDRLKEIFPTRTGVVIILQAPGKRSSAKGLQALEKGLKD
ncbi:MAG: hypothetical protein Q9160_004078 [Pyrenula sp. 1 TL-2023]